MDTQNYCSPGSGEATSTRESRVFLQTTGTTEHYEISVYGNLALLADRMGEGDVADLLNETLDEEKAALDTLCGLTEGHDYDYVMLSGAGD